MVSLVDRLKGSLSASDHNLHTAKRQAVTSIFTRSARALSCAVSDFSQVFCPRSVIPRLIPKHPATIEITPLVTYYQFLSEALARVKCMQRSTMDNKIWLSTHLRMFFFCDKIVRTYVRPLMLADVNCQTY